MSKVLRIALTASLFFLAAAQVQATLLTWTLSRMSTLTMAVLRSASSDTTLPPRLVAAPRGA